ncbi:Deubiquitinase OTUD6B [Nymphon striatum]|nr:Deubiquitinase OTUD6B [Nymphon striatum]
MTLPVESHNHDHEWLTCGENDIETINKRHKTENKELQAKIQALKHSIPKNDKKRKKDMLITVAQMETELEMKHQNEIAEYQNSENKLEASVKNLSINEESSEMPQNVNRISKAQRKREKKLEKEKQSKERIAEEKINSLSGNRNQEILQFKQILLFAAVVHQCSLQDIQMSVEDLRNKVAEHMKNNIDDFIPFLSNKDTGDPFSEEEFQSYCNEIATTNAWGGQLESNIILWSMIDDYERLQLQALSELLNYCVQVYQAVGPIITIGDKFKGKHPSLKLSYHRHIYGLGEHYNSLISQSN